MRRLPDGDCRPGREERRRELGSWQSGSPLSDPACANSVAVESASPRPFHEGEQPSRMELSSVNDKGVRMSVYRVIDVIGTSASSWEEAAREAISTAGGTLHDLRIAEVAKQDIVVSDDGTLLFRSRIQLSFKYTPE
jgi:flavin-binding protein dodecin